MLENPQAIINIYNNTTSILERLEQLPDAIYIPFLNRYQNLNALLSSLKWFDKEIIILVSNENDSTKINTTQNYQVKLINCSKSNWVKQIRQLETFKPYSFYHGVINWDLPSKRNFALVHAVHNSFRNILLIDDDIEGITRQIINKGITALKSNNIAGCLVKGFPDTSVIGHIEQMYGEPYFPFISGNFLFISPEITDGFFPLIYNEDWLFMIPSILQKKVSAVDTIFQKDYNPFNDICRIRFQEFGEIIAEGLFELISQEKFGQRFNESFWNEYLVYRKTYVEELLAEAEVKFIPFIKESITICEKVKAKDCVDFIEDWEKDILTFRKIKNNET